MSHYKTKIDWQKPIDTYPVKYNPWHGSGEYEFRERVAEGVCEWIPENCKHHKGEFAGQPFALEDWERQIVGHLFAWFRQDGTRRYRTCFLYVPKKNGKTCLTAALGLLLMVADDEPGAEIYSCSGDREQATLGFSEAVYYIETNDVFSDHIEVFQGYKSFKYAAAGSYWKVLSSEARTKHGPNVHGLLVDELHVFRDAELLDTLTAGHVSRRQPVTIYTTTAAPAGENVCNNEVDYARGVRDGRIKNPHYLPALWEASREDADNWRDLDVWRRVNPNFGISINASYCRDQLLRVKDKPSEVNKLKRLHLNIQTESVTQWIDVEAWGSCPAPTQGIEDTDSPCYVGLDLGRTKDITGLVGYWPESGDVRAEAWVPEAALESGVNHEMYQQWYNDGYLKITPGNVTDYNFIEKRITEIFKGEWRGAQAMAYDPWNATQLINNLTEKHGMEDELVLFRQGPLSFNEPTKELEALVMAQRLRHGSNPVLNWMIGNACVRMDENENIRPVKQSKNSNKKIDMVIALVMAIGISMTTEEDNTSYILEI